MRSASRKARSLSGLASESRMRTSMIAAVYITAAETPDPSNPSACVMAVDSYRRLDWTTPRFGGSLIGVKHPNHAVIPRWAFPHTLRSSCAWIGRAMSPPRLGCHLRDSIVGHFPLDGCGDACATELA
jgi:hypothetical protein